jgi:hypothetical protein
MRANGIKARAGLWSALAADDGIFDKIYQPKK